MTSVNWNFVNVLPGGSRNFSLRNKEDDRLQESFKADLPPFQDRHKVLWHPEVSEKLRLA